MLILRLTPRGVHGPGTNVEAGPALLRETVAVGARDVFPARWVAANGGYGPQTFVEGEAGPEPARGGAATQGRGPSLGPHAQRPGHKRQFYGCFDRRTWGAWPAQP